MTRGRVSLAVSPLLVLLVACGSGDPAPVAVVSVDKGAMPAALDIPALGLHVDELQMFGTGVRDGGYACPPAPDVVSWDSSRPRPGQPGMARLVASGQGAFRRLADLSDADPIVLTFSDGRRVTFTRSAPVIADADVRAPSLELSACSASAAATVYAGLVP